MSARIASVLIDFSLTGILFEGWNTIFLRVFLSFDVLMRMIKSVAFVQNVDN